MNASNRDRLEEATFEQSVFNADGSVNVGSPFIQQSMYGLQLRPWLELFPKKQFFIVDGDRFKKEQVAVLNEVEHFLGIEQQITKDRFVYNKERHLYCVKTPSGGQACLSSGKGRPHPTLKSTDNYKLKKFFQPYNEHFFQQFNKTYPWWISGIPKQTLDKIPIL